MGRKARAKKYKKLESLSYVMAETATPEQLEQAQGLLKNIMDKHLDKKSLAFCKDLDRVFIKYGDDLGALVMAEFAKSQNYQLKAY